MDEADEICNAWLRIVGVDEVDELDEVWDEWLRDEVVVELGDAWILLSRTASYRVEYDIYTVCIDMTSFSTINANVPFM